MAAVAMLGSLAAAACGNYSNEDLEFMNAFPESDQLQVSMPPRSAAIRLADEAELSRTTHDVTRSLNGLLGAIVGIVDFVRSFPPTSRTPDSRTWGPFPSDDHPGWQVRMRIQREPGNPAQLNYDLAFHRAGAADTEWPVLLDGWFLAGQTVRHGSGHFRIATAAVRAAGLDPNFDRLDVLLVDYATDLDPLTIAMDITNLPDPLDPAALSRASYDYKAAADGRRQMTFDFSGNAVPGPMIETMLVTSRWLETGEGGGSMVIEEGEGAGLQEAQCWDRSFLPIYSHKDWAPAEDTGDPAACVTVEPL